METGRTELSKDTRKIVSVEKGIGEDILYFKVGGYHNKNIITSICAYDEFGQNAYIPWIAIYIGEQIVFRFDAVNCIICYEIEE